MGPALDSATSLAGPGDRAIQGGSVPSMHFRGRRTLSWCPL